MATHLFSIAFSKVTKNVNMNMWNKRNMLKGPFQTPAFTGAKFNGNEENLLFSLICISRRMWSLTFETGLNIRVRFLLRIQHLILVLEFTFSDRVQRNPRIMNRLHLICWIHSVCRFFIWGPNPFVIFPKIRKTDWSLDSRIPFWIPPKKRILTYIKFLRTTNANV